MRKFMVALGLLFLLGLPASALTFLYPSRNQAGDSQEEVEISRTLARNKTRGCGEYTYRRAGRGEYHVACWSASGTPTYYIVFTVTGVVMGPYTK
jgi:hypothetical protein